MALFVESGQSGSIVRVGTAVIDFGDVPAIETAVSVIGQAGITSSSQIRISLQGDTTVGNGVEDHLLAATSIRLTAGTPVAGVGFDIHADSQFALWTKGFRVRWTWWD